jgi:hypothetical protein
VVPDDDPGESRYDPPHWLTKSSSSRTLPPLIPGAEDSSDPVPILDPFLEKAKYAYWALDPKQTLATIRILLLDDEIVMLLFRVES